MPNFRIPQSFLGNIGELLDYNQPRENEDEFGDEDIAGMEPADEGSLPDRNSETSGIGLRTDDALRIDEQPRSQPVASTSPTVRETAPATLNYEDISLPEFTGDLSHVFQDAGDMDRVSSLVFECRSGGRQSDVSA